MIQKVALIGAGAIGAYFIKELDNNVTVIAQGKRYEKLKSEGIYINDIHYDLHVSTPLEDEIFDLAIICTKYNGLDDAIDMLKEIMNENTIVLSPLNGVDSEEKIGSVVGMEHMVYSLMRIGSRREGNHIYFDDHKISDIYYGSLETNDRKLKELTDYFSTTNVKFHCLDNILSDMWTKYASNIANNLPQAIVGLPSKMYFEGEHGRFIADKLYQEVYLIAKAKGIDIPKKTIFFDSVPKVSKFSTLQDIEAKRHTEIDMFLGVLLKYGKQYNITLPYSEYTYHLIKLLEEKNDGLFELNENDY